MRTPEQIPKEDLKKASPCPPQDKNIRRDKNTERRNQRKGFTLWCLLFQGRVTKPPLRSGNRNKRGSKACRKSEWPSKGEPCCPPLGLSSRFSDTHTRTHADLMERPPNGDRSKITFVHLKEKRASRRRRLKASPSSDSPAKEGWGAAGRRDENVKERTKGEQMRLVPNLIADIPEPAAQTCRLSTTSARTMDASHAAKMLARRCATLGRAGGPACGVTLQEGKGREGKRRAGPSPQRSSKSTTSSRFLTFLRMGPGALGGRGRPLSNERKRNITSSAQSPQL